MMVALVLAPWRMANFYECLGERCCFHLQGDGITSRQTLKWLEGENGTIIQNVSWVICHISGGNDPNFKWRRLTEHLYPNLNCYEKKRCEKNLTVSQLQVLCPFNVMSVHCTGPSWADSQAKQYVVPFMLLNSCLVQLIVWRCRNSYYVLPQPIHWHVFRAQTSRLQRRWSIRTTERG